MKNGIVVADSGPIFSLAIIERLDLLDLMFEEVKIPLAVWKEITFDKSQQFYQYIHDFFQYKIQEIESFNELTFTMDYGESESVILYKELNANFLLIDDKKARNIADYLEVNCIGTLGLLIASKNTGFVKALLPLFKKFYTNKRYYSPKLLNTILRQHNEKPFDFQSLL